jgi:hypothetical protein
MDVVNQCAAFNLTIGRHWITGMHLQGGTTSAA